LMAIEIVFAEGLDLFCEATRTPPPFSVPAGAALLVECASTTSPLDELAAGIASLGRPVLDSAVAGEGPTIRRLSRHPEGVPEATGGAGGAHKMDVACPRARLADFSEAVRARIAELAPGARAVLFGHAAEGNLHVNILGLDPADETVDRAVLSLAVEF